MPRSAAAERQAAILSACGRSPREDAELAVVRGEHGRPVRDHGAADLPRRRSMPLRRSRRRRPPPGRLRRAMQSRTARRVSSSRPSPGPITSDPNRPMSDRASTANPAVPIACWTTSLRVFGRQPGADSDTRPLPPRSAAAVHSSAAPGIDSLPAMTFTAPCHLCASAARRGHQPSHVGCVDEMARGRRRVEPDVGNDDLPSEFGAGVEQQAGLERLERDGPVGTQHAVACCAGESVDPTRDVDGENECAPDVRCSPRAGRVGAVARAVCGVDHEVGRWQQQAGTMPRRSLAPSRRDVGAGRRHHAHRRRCCRRRR